jgi:hypothetical protein
MSKEKQSRAIVEEANLIYGYTQEEIDELRAQVMKRRKELFGTPKVISKILSKESSDGKGKSGASSAS